jgi:integrase
MGRVKVRAQGQRPSEEAIETKIKTLRPSRRSKTFAELREEAQVKLWNESAKTAVKKYCLTLFRHSFCHRLLKSKVDALTVSTLLGHADATMVAAVYSHMNHAPDYLLETLVSAG